eukprot:TRINITY_DN7914_c0_g1_i4.p1 TRINITY_DN7914_c0_g1~~TRINITY_DN7914_c0_g1_i4.p1  ORF type:complete len:334 (+),score=232.90 TRINITY_DN7914_c0_g1_i4:3-1004(+)
MPGQMQPITTASAATNTSTPAASAPSSAAKSTPPPAATTSSVPRTSSNPSVPRTSAGGTGAFVPSDGQATKCLGCAKTVYPNEAIRACNGSWHKTCLKCTTCQLTLNLKTAESFQNKPYCKTHKPNAAHTQVTDSVAVKQATSAPKAARAVQGVKRDQRTTFMPGQMQPITTASAATNTSTPAASAPSSAAKSTPPPAATTSSVPRTSSNPSVPRTSAGGTGAFVPSDGQVTNTEVVKGFNSTGNNNNNNAPSANFHQHSAPAPGAHHHHQDSYENTSTDQYYEQSEDAYEQAQDAYEQAQDGYDYGQQDYEYGEQAGEYVEQAAGGGEDDWD